MEENRYTCAKCGNPMVRGYGADKSQVHLFTLSWVDGEPVNATMLGITGDNLNMRGPTPRVVRGLRCSKCGLIQHYAV